MLRLASALALLIQAHSNTAAAATDLQICSLLSGVLTRFRGKAVAGAGFAGRLLDTVDCESANRTLTRPESRPLTRAPGRQAEAD